MAPFSFLKETLSPGSGERAVTSAPLSLERRITRLETLVWILVALNLPEVLMLTEVLI